MKVVRFTKTMAEAYSFRFEDGWGWVIFTVNDATGELSIQSDWGDWAHRWNIDALASPSLKHFLADRADCDYIACKLVPSDQQQIICPESSQKKMRQEILRQRREHDIGDFAARGAWDAVDNVECDSFDRFHATVSEQLHLALGSLRTDADGSQHFDPPTLEDFVVMVDAPRFLKLRDELLPVLVDKLTEELTNTQGVTP